MTVGIVMLVHTALDRAEQVIRHWVDGGCPVVVHVDANTANREFEVFKGNLSDLKTVKFCRRHRCEWGTWGIVAGTLSASEMMLSSFDEVTHVYLASGSCLPLRPVKELRRYLESRPRVDFIESATTAEVPWTVGGWMSSGSRCGSRFRGAGIGICLTATSRCSGPWASSARSRPALCRTWEASGGA